MGTLAGAVKLDVKSVPREFDVSVPELIENPPARQHVMKPYASYGVMLQEPAPPMRMLDEENKPGVPEHVSWDAAVGIPC